MKNAIVASFPGWIKLFWQAVNRDLTKRELRWGLATGFILFIDHGLAGTKLRLLEKAT